MRKKSLFNAALFSVTAAITLNSCMGSFSLSKKMLAWNQTIDTKFVNQLIFVGLCIVPVYPIAMVADLLVFNSIEFWTGDNPVEEGIVQHVKSENGSYTITSTADGYHIDNEAGYTMNLVFDKETKTWSSVANGIESKLLKIEDDKKSAIVYMPDGKEMSIKLDEQGLLAFRKTVNDVIYLANK